MGGSLFARPEKYTTMDKNVLNGEEQLNGCTLRNDGNGNKTVEISWRKVQELNEWIDQLNGIDALAAVSDFVSCPTDTDAGIFARSEFMKFYRVVCQVANDVRHLVPGEWIYGNHRETNMGY